VDAVEEEFARADEVGVDDLRVVDLTQRDLQLLRVAKAGGGHDRRAGVEREAQHGLGVVEAQSDGLVHEDRQALLEEGARLLEVQRAVARAHQCRIHQSEQIARVLDDDLDAPLVLQRRDSSRVVILVAQRRHDRALKVRGLRGVGVEDAAECVHVR
jgi:hypothetical protein